MRPDIVTISTDNLLETNEFRAAVGAGWMFLSDPGRRLQKGLDIAEYTDPDHNSMIPHTLVLEPDGRTQAQVFDVHAGQFDLHRFPPNVTFAGAAASLP
jgi:peroxiredoxin